MAWFIDTWRSRYPQTILFLAGDFLSLTRDNSKIWNAFLSITEMKPDQALESIRFGPSSESPPLIFFKDLGPAVAGYFEQDHSARILINAEIARQFEGAYQDPRARLFVQGKVLHELVHWALFAQGKVELKEMGIEFESLAYDVALSAFWLTDPAPAQPAGPPVTPRALENTWVSPIGATAGLDAPGSGVGLPRGIRNNNPGNIKRSVTEWEGLADPGEMTEFQRRETVFCVFRTSIWGLRAMALNLWNYQRKLNLLSVDAMISRWAPPSDNNRTDNYIDFVSQRVNVGKTQPIDFANSNYAVPMIAAMVQMENGIQPYSTEQIIQAHAMATA
jgi:hypothetical protein